MTQNQLAYLQHEETKRANQAREAETQRSNLANEAERTRSARAQETELQRSHRANERETQRHNLFVEGDTAKNTEERIRSNLAQEVLKRLGLDEAARHNLVTEDLDLQSMMARNALLAQQTDAQLLKNLAYRDTQFGDLINARNDYQKAFMSSNLRYDEDGNIIGGDSTVQRMDNITMMDQFLRDLSIGVKFGNSLTSFLDAPTDELISMLDE